MQPNPVTHVMFSHTIVTYGPPQVMFAPAICNET